MIRLSVAMVCRNSFLVLLISAGLLAVAPSARGAVSDYEDLRVSLRAQSRLIFIGGAGTPVSLFLGSEDKSACPDPNSPDCHPTCNAIDNGDGYGVTLRVFKDRRSPSESGTPGDASPFRICDEESQTECAGATTPVSDASLSQEDGVARVAVTWVDLPEGACVTTQATDSFFFEFKKLCNVNLVASSGHRTAAPDPNIPEDPNTPSCQGAFEDQGFGRFSESVFADPTAPDPDNFKNIPLLTNDPNVVPTWEARQNGLRLKLPLVGVQKKFGGLGTFTADIELSFEVTTGFVGGQNIPVPSTVQRVIPLGSGANGAPIQGSRLDPEDETIHFVGAVATSTNPAGQTPPSAYNIWGSSIAFLNLEADVAALTDDTVASALAQVFPDDDSDGVVNAVDSDDDNDGLLDDGEIDDVGSFGIPHPASECETEDGAPTTPGECLQGNFEASFLASLLCTSKSAVTSSLDADTDDDGLADGSHDQWTLPGPPVRLGEDTNFDGCLDTGETKPTAFDTDFDGIGDGRESSVEDSDLTVVLRGGPRTLASYVAVSIPDLIDDGDPGTFTDPLDADTDNDGLPDGAHPVWANDDPPPCLDGEDIDKDGFVDPGETNPNDEDSDVGGGDELLDGREVQLSLEFLNDELAPGVPFLSAVNHTPEFIADNITVSDPNAAKCTDALDPDSDDDGFEDGYEVTTPYVAFEPALGAFTNPNDADTDSDEFCDGPNTVGAPANCAGGDNCPLIFNPPIAPSITQLNTDGDALGDACDPDDDNDGVLDGADNCPKIPNLDQLNTDGDLEGNACDFDDDNDGILDTAELGIALGSTNPLDADSDDDARCDGLVNVLFPASDPADCTAPDNCPINNNPTQTNTDGDLQGDECDLDDDADGIPDTTEELNGTDPLDADIDDDDFCDGDVDVPIVGSTTLDCQAGDNCPNNNNPLQTDTDVDDVGDACDNCFFEPNADQLNTGGFFGNLDFYGDACQCGDVTDAVGAGPDGAVDAPNDIKRIREFLAPFLDSEPPDLDHPPSSSDPTRVPDTSEQLAEIGALCPINGTTGSCTILDVALLQRAAAAASSDGLFPVCRAAACLADPTGDPDGDCLPASEDACKGFPNEDGAADTYPPGGDGVPDVCQCGDTDADGAITQTDVSRLGECATQANVCDPTLGDLDRDGDIDLLDLSLLEEAIDDDAVAALMCVRRGGPL